MGKEPSIKTVHKHRISMMWVPVVMLACCDLAALDVERRGAEVVRSQIAC